MAAPAHTHNRCPLSESKQGVIPHELQRFTAQFFEAFPQIKANKGLRIEVKYVGHATFPFRAGSLEAQGEGDLFGPQERLKQAGSPAALAEDAA